MSLVGQWHCLPQAHRRQGTEPPTAPRASPTRLGVGMAPTVPTAGGTGLPPRPQGKPDSSVHTPATVRFGLCTHYQKPPFGGCRERKQHAPSPVPILPAPCHRPRPLKFLVRHPQSGFTLGQTWQVPRNVCTVRRQPGLPTTASPSLLPPPPCSRAALLAQTQSGKGGGVAHGSLKSTLRTLEHMAGAGSTVRGLKGHHGSFHVLTLGKACTWQATSYSGSQRPFPGQPTPDGTALCDIRDPDVSQGVQVVTPCSPPLTSPWQPCDFSKVSNSLLHLP